MAQSIGEAEVLGHLAGFFSGWAQIWQRAQGVQFELLVVCLRRGVGLIAERAAAQPANAYLEAKLCGAQRGLSVVEAAFAPEGKVASEAAVPDPAVAAAEAEAAFFREAERVLGRGSEER